MEVRWNIDSTSYFSLTAINIYFKLSLKVFDNACQAIYLFLITINVYKNASFTCIACWSSDPHQRPNFVHILHELEEISKSPFMNTPQESFHTLQEDWRHEIAEMFHELRCKEKVYFMQQKDFLIVKR